jgi:integrase/recombinase XerD
MITESYIQIHEQYARWLDILGFADTSIQSFNRNIKDFFEYLESKNILSVTELTQKHIYTYFEYLQTRPNKLYKGTGLSVTHLNHNFDAVDKLCEFLYQSGLETSPVPTNFRLYVDKEERIRKIQPFTQEEIKQLYNNIDKTFEHLPFAEQERKHEQLKLIFALYYGCGLRMSEGLKLTTKDIDFDKKTIFIHQGKGYKDRIVPMSGGVYKIIENYIYNFRNLQKLNHNRLFINAKAPLRRSLDELKKVCKIEKRLKLHILRHSIATHLLQNGVSIENIAQFLGHSSLTSTQIYTHFI